MVFTAQLGRENQVGYLRIKSLGMGFSPFEFYYLSPLTFCLPLMASFVSLTTISSSDVFTDKRHTAPRLSLVNVQGLNKLLRSEVFISVDRQLRAVHLILDYEPLLNIFQDKGQALRAGDPRLAHIDIFVPGFLAQRDLPLVELPLQHSSREVAILKEETTSSHLFLKAEIDQFCLEEEREATERPVELSNSEAEFDKLSAAHSPRLVVARFDTSSGEEEEMASNQRRCLKDLVAGRNKGSSSKEAPKTQLPPNLPPPPPLPVTTVRLLPCPDLKKKRKVQEVEEGKVVLPKGAK